MNRSRLVMVVLMSAVLLVGVTGCPTQEDYNKCTKLSGERLARIQDLEAAQERQLLRAGELQGELDAAQIESQAYDAKLAEMQRVLDERMADLALLGQQVGGIALPAELNTALSDWSMQSGSDLVSYDPETGVVRFKSDLLFNKGSDTVQPGAAQQVRSLAGILNSSAAMGFDVLVVGHTDDVPIKRAATKAKHPTNWHLSAHRAISVQKLLAGAGVAESRTAVVGMGEFRPIEPNKANKGGNPRNRRVEMYIVPAKSIGG